MNHPSPSTNHPAASASSETTGYGEEAKLARTVGITLAWWAHGGVRLLLAVALVYYGVAKVVLGQFGVADMGDALIAQGEMSPMGMLWRMVAFSPVFQFLAGLAELGAGLALLWRRTAALGATIGAGSMALVFVLNLGYDVPVKQISLVMLVMSLIVLAPWMPRLARAFIGRGPIPRGPLPVLVPWRPLARITDVALPLAGIALAVLVGWGTTSMYPERSSDASAPAGVWMVQEDTAEPAEQLAEDQRWQQVAFGEVTYDGTAQMQVRLASGDLLNGAFERTDAGTVEATLRPLRETGQDVQAYQEVEPQQLVLTIEEQPDGTLHLSGDDQDLVLAPNPEGSMLYERGFSWGARPDDPFNR